MSGSVRHDHAPRARLSNGLERLERLELVKLIAGLNDLKRLERFERSVTCDQLNGAKQLTDLNGLNRLR